MRDLESLRQLQALPLDGKITLLVVMNDMLRQSEGKENGHASA